MSAPNPNVFRMYRVEWERPQRKTVKMDAIEAIDVAESFGEACEIALIRARNGALPCRVTIIDERTGRKERQYRKDCSAHVMYVEAEFLNPRPSFAGVTDADVERAFGSKAA